MAYVPPPLSPRARELGERITETIEAYRKDHPDLSWMDIVGALRVASRRSGANRPRMILALAIGALMLVFLLVAYAQERSSGESFPVAAVAILVGGLGIGLLVYRLKA